MIIQKREKFDADRYPFELVVFSAGRVHQTLRMTAGELEVLIDTAQEELATNQQTERAEMRPMLQSLIKHQDYLDALYHVSNDLPITSKAGSLYTHTGNCEAFAVALHYRYELDNPRNLRSRTYQERCNAA